MKKFNLLLILIILPLHSYAKEIRLEDCQSAAQKSSPLAKQRLLIETKYNYDERSLTANYLPQLSIDAQATKQSEVIKLQLPLPNIKLPVIPTEQYKINLNINQLIWDGGATSANKDMKLSESSVSKKVLDVSLYNIKDIINQLFFNIILTQENINTLKVSLSQLDSNSVIINSLVKNGVMLRSSMESINIEMLKIRQNLEQLNSTKTSLVSMMARWTETEISNNDEFILPGIKSEDYNQQKRIEYDLFNVKDKLAESSAGIVRTQLWPKIFAFGTGGYGNPNPINFFDTKGSFYYIVGLKLQWTPFDWNSNNNKVQSILVNKQITDTERENFKKGLNINVVKEETDLRKYDALLSMDTEIIERQQRIIDEYFSRLKNNTITIVDYLSQVNAMTAAKISRDIHRIQQVRSKVNLLILTGNY